MGVPHEKGVPPIGEHQDPLGKADCLWKRRASNHALLNDNVVVGLRTNGQIGKSGRNINGHHPTPTESWVSGQSVGVVKQPDTVGYGNRPSV